MELPIYIKRENVNTKEVRDMLPHWHNDIELIYVLKGELECQTNESVFPLNKGDLCFINRNQLHHLYSQNVNDSQHIALIVSTNLLTQNKQIYDTYISPMIEDMSFSHVKFESTNDYGNKIHECLLKIEDLLNAKDFGYELEVVANLHMIFKYLYCTYKFNDKSINILDENLILQQKMINYIKENYNEKITLEDISLSANVSRSMCFRLFKKYTRISPITYLNNYRLEMGADKLIHSRESISNISQACGFSQQSYFNRLFLKEYNCTPAQYRRKRE